MKSNYALSGWIANLGVVPLFSFAFFLFAPDFFNFFFLIVRVCVVFEAISKSLCFLLTFNYRGIFLSRFPSVVKIFLLISTFNHVSHAAKKDIFLSKGEQIELSVGKLTSFSVGNKEVLKYKYLPKKGKILVKGKSLGFSDLVVWSKKKEVYHFYVTSKREQLKRMEIAQILKSTSLKTKVSGDIIYVDGEVKTVTAFLLLKNIERKNLENLILNVTISPEVRNKIISNLYKDFYNANYDYIYCKLIKTNIFCQYTTINRNKNLESRYSKEYLVSFYNQEKEFDHKNYKLTFKIVSTETSKNSASNSGFNSINADLSKLIEKNVLNLKAENIYLRDNDLLIKLLARPVVTTTVNDSFQIQMGGEVPYLSNENEEQKTLWKFAGLKLQGKLSIDRNSIKLKYKSTITKGGEKGVSGPKGNSSIYLSFNKLNPLFTVQMTESLKGRGSVPGLNKVPILKELFSSTDSSYTSKSITVYVSITEQ